MEMILNKNELNSDNVSDLNFSLTELKQQKEVMKDNKIPKSINQSLAKKTKKKENEIVDLNNKELNQDLNNYTYLNNPKKGVVFDFNADLDVDELDEQIQDIDYEESETTYFESGKEKSIDVDLYNMYVKDISGQNEIEKSEEAELFQKMDETNRFLNKEIFKDKDCLDLVMLLDNHNQKNAIITFYDIDEKDENILLSKIKSLKEELNNIAILENEQERKDLFQKTVSNIKFDYGFLKFCIEEDENLHYLKKDLRFLKYAKNKIINKNLKLVIKIAKNYKSSHLDFIDLIQEGNIGLIKGIEKFKHQMGYKLSTYVSWWIKQSINDSLTKKSRSIKLPSNIVNTLFKIKKMEVEENISRDKFTPRELSKILNIDEEKIVKALSAPEETVSLDLVVGNDGDKDISFGDMIAGGEEYEPSYHFNLDEKHKEVLKMIETLDEREQIVIKHRFGIGEGGNIKTLEEIGNMIGLTRERIRQIEGEAINKLKEYNFEYGLS